MRFLSTFEPITHLTLNTALKRGQRLQSFFRKQRVDLVFLHGSLAKDALKPLSDVDIAVLFTTDDYDYKKISEISSKLSKVLNREDIDLAILNHASPLLWMQILCNSKILYCRSQKALKQFRLRAIQKYLATKHLRDTFHHYMEESILRG
ncbi:MAG: hypothetical protein A2W61_07630 [Deltaproteobacteria bacterium RIFCSPLOWO2_01_44_7]|nr:MAG: hypothetical protein A2712_04340 [Deltaproteobacteria bacterium RIFCSPHIGHO2_01_FULL_43_49]OGQ16413.1 MAG: hypothetical protein A3D22_02305 [Deltaproteobacteria bacterium RIFCSPHIGHO2_02_FULL_44_53]OGQ27760.1 MAG: hypothetical protein A3D98_08680 [Deltaproteobacteria bacterium RIFCSPHIGHO2_12_FULL_44_21]OGQ32931.1 MAG: hypothetical protein A2979_10235 [Deltaproteobacteria bacterium RIFCSPLOWO2_01_FULL_45_74]OGQ38696.1 MAG: hypothetical protein A2W61_07630 [Deltaproteobacteria bacterium 